MELELGIGDVRLSGLSSAVELEIGVGDLTVDTTGALEASIGAGSISGTTGPLQAEVGAGNVRLEGLRSSVDVGVSAGDVSLSWLTLPEEIEVMVGAGNVNIVLPDGAVIDTELDTGVGQISCKPAQETSAPSKVEVDIGVGRIRIE